MLAFSQDDPGAAARLFKEFGKKAEYDKLVVRNLSVSGALLPASELERVASLPTREQALSMLLACMKAPVEKLARTLNEVPGKLVRTVEAIRMQKAEG
jgi:large subunit ribosomal protein L10